MACFPGLIDTVRGACSRRDQSALLAEIEDRIYFDPEAGQL